MRGSISGAMPIPVSRDAERQLAPSALRRQLDPAARLGVLGRVVQQVAEHLLQPDGSASHATAAARQRTASVWRRSSISGRTVSTARATTSASVHGLAPQLDLARA